jgi:hypothetical protein
MPERPAPRCVDATVAFDDTLVLRFMELPCVLCQCANPRYYVWWQDSETGYVMMFNLCERCHQRPDKAVQLTEAMWRRMHRDAAP